jgi:hypothetical protein
VGRRAVHPPAAPRVHPKSLDPSSYLLQIEEDETGDVFYLHAPSPFSGPISITHAILNAAGAAKGLAKLFRDPTPLEEEIIDDLVFVP